MRAKSIDTSVGRRIRTLRTNAGLTIHQLAERADIDGAYLGGVERGVENPTLKVITKIARSLDVEAATLFDQEGERNIDALRRIVATRAQRLSRQQLETLVRLMDLLRLS